MPGLDQLQGNLTLDRLGLLGNPDFAHAPFADLFLQRVPAGNQEIGCDVGLYWTVIEIGDGSRSALPVCSPVASVSGRPGLESIVASAFAGESRKGPEASCAASSASTAREVRACRRRPRPEKPSVREVDSQEPRGTESLRSWAMPRNWTRRLCGPHSMRRNAEKSTRDSAIISGCAASRRGPRDEARPVRKSSGDQPLRGRYRESPPRDHSSIRRNSVVQQGGP